jgi:hypothetical protein
MFFICEIASGVSAPGLETDGVDFFEADKLPELSVSRVLDYQIARMFAHAAAPRLMKSTIRANAQGNDRLSPTAGNALRSHGHTFVSTTQVLHRRRTDPKPLDAEFRGLMCYSSVTGSPFSGRN